MDDARADWSFRLGLLSLVVPILGPFVWMTASRALAGEASRSSYAPAPTRLVWARRLGIAATALLACVLAFGLLAGQPVEAP